MCCGLLEPSRPGASNPSKTGQWNASELGAAFSSVPSALLSLSLGQKYRLLRVELAALSTSPTKSGGVQFTYGLGRLLSPPHDVALALSYRTDQAPILGRKLHFSALDPRYFGELKQDAFFIRSLSTLLPLNVGDGLARAGIIRYGAALCICIACLSSFSLSLSFPCQHQTSLSSLSPLCACL